MDLTMAYAILEGFKAAKKEMDEKGISFDEFLEHFEEGILILEKIKKENSCRA